jgi:hypothetical protein
MAIYNNNYNKEEDFSMWELHEIRHKMSEEGIDPQKVNDNARKLLQEMGCENLLVNKRINHKSIKNE